MLYLKVGNIETDIVGDINTSDFFSEFILLRKKMSFRTPGYLFSPAYKTGKWDGWRRLAWLNKKRCYFPTGLVSIAKEHFKERGIEFKIVDTRIKPEQTLFLDINEDFELRDYQEKMSDSALAVTRGIGQSSTGSGKTLVSASIIQKCKVSPFLFLVTSIDLLEQSKTAFESYLLKNGQNIKVGSVGGGTFDIQDITVMTVHTAVRALGKKFIKFDDEEKTEKDDETLLEQHRDEIVNLLKTSKGIICDECITGDSILITKNGPEKIKNFEYKIGTEVLSYDGNNTVWKKMTHFYKKGKQKTIKIILSNGSFIQCTENHLIGTAEGWIFAENIKQNDLILHYDNTEKYIEVESIIESTEQEVFDITVEDTHCFFANGLLVHNCQHWRADMCQIVTNSLDSAYYRYGFSATPWRDEGDDMLIQACFGKTFCEISASELIKKGYLVKPNIHFVHVNSAPSKLRDWQNIYKSKVVEDDYYNSLVATVTEEYIKKGDRVLVLVQQIEHGKRLENLIDGSYFIHGSCTKKDRLDSINKLRNGYIKCLIGSTIIDEGVDIRALNTLILAGQGKSSTRALQRVGRTLRIFPEKTHATIVDFWIHEKYLEDHAKARERIYKTEPEFVINHSFVD